MKMQYKEQPAAARKAKCLEIMEREFRGGLSPHCYEDIVAIKETACAELGSFYGDRAVRTTIAAICVEKGWAQRPAAQPKPEKNGLGARMDQIDTRMSSGEATVLELGKRINDLAGIVKDVSAVTDKALVMVEGIDARVKALEGEGPATIKESDG